MRPFRSLAYALMICFAVLFPATAFTDSVAGIAAQNTPEVVFGDVDDGTPREDKPEVVIEAPASVKVGEMIVIDVSKSQGEGFDMKIIPEPSQVRVFEGGKVICTSTGNQSTEYLFIISCALGGKSDVKTKVVKVVGAEPVVPDQPGKNIPAKVLAWCDSVASPTARDDAIKLAQSFASLATVIKSGAFADPGEIVAATKTSNRDALGDNLQHWVPLLDGLMVELKAMADAGMLPDATSHAGVWEDVAKGLRQYAAKLTPAGEDVPKT